MKVKILDNIEYRKCYYIHNKDKLIEYSKNYYLFKKTKGDLDNVDITENMKIFLSKYKKQKIPVEKTKFIIKNDLIKLTFN
tara:strand:+ start:132 stop:374 length:243 start_codon:yes stop_codon:yes gene_type:complete